MAELLYTFVIERAGSTIVEQAIAGSLFDALVSWARHSPYVRGVDPMAASFVEPSAISGTTNTWFFSSQDADGVSLFVNVVATVRDPAPPRTVFLVQHVHEFEDGSEDVKAIGIYSTRHEAELAVARSRQLPGFAGIPDGFSIDEYSIDVDHWTSGFVTER